MNTQPTLFNEKQQRRGDSHVFVQQAPDEEHEMYAPQDSAPEPLSHAARREAFERLKADGRRDNLRARYARLLYKALAGGVQINGRTLRSLTDKEAAHLLGCQYTTINGRRGELMGKDDSLPEYQKCPAVEEHTMRRSLIMDSGQDVTAFRIRRDLFTQDQ